MDRVHYTVIKSFPREEVEADGRVKYERTAEAGIDYPKDALFIMDMEIQNRCDLDDEFVVMEITRKDRTVQRVVFNTEAYILNDNGGTVERIPGHSGRQLRAI